MSGPSTGKARPTSRAPCPLRIEVPSPLPVVIVTVALWTRRTESPASRSFSSPQLSRACFGEDSPNGQHTEPLALTTKLRGNHSSVSATSPAAWQALPGFAPLCGARAWWRASALPSPAPAPSSSPSASTRVSGLIAPALTASTSRLQIRHEQPSSLPRGAPGCHTAALA